MKKSIFYTAVTLLFVFSCKKEKDNSIDNLVFGDAYGFCAGDCATFYQLKGGSLYPDDIDRYSGNEVLFKSTALPADKYQMAKVLLENFPEYLLNNPDTVFGCPDCADQGGYYLQYTRNGTTLKWSIDTNPTSQPEAIRSYVEKLQSVLTQLR